jgi:hypothetical protein
VKIDFCDGSGLEFRAEFLRLLAHVLNELRPQDAIREAREILDVRGERKLSAGLVAVDDQRLEVRAPGIDGGGQTSAATADNYDIVHSRSLQHVRFGTAPAGYSGGIVAFPLARPEFRRRPIWRTPLRDSR